MNLRTYICSVLAVALASAAAAQTQPVAEPSTSAQLQADLPRTPQGHPDLQGVVWNTNFLLPLEATPMLPDLVISEERAVEFINMVVPIYLAMPDVAIDPESEIIIGATEGLAIVRGERRTRAVVLPEDGRIPYTREARERVSNAMKAILGTSADNPEERPTGERCLSLGALAPTAGTQTLNPRRFIQTTDHIVIQYEYGNEARIIPLADAHDRRLVDPHYGNAIARWDGDTLEIETTGLPVEDTLRPFPALIVRPEATVIERFTRLSARELLYQFTVIDPEIYTAEWLAEYSLYAADFPMFPSACHEGNYSLENIMKAARIDEVRSGLE